MLNGWLPSDLGGKWRILFRASRDGFAAETFHSRCDNKGPTVTIVKSGGNIFGGFTKESWRSQGLWVTCSQAFLFSMVNPHGLGPAKLPLVTGQEQHAIYCVNSHGPTFGGGHDFCISSNANLITVNSSYSNLGFSYQRPPGQQSTFFSGAKNFKVTDYEVFSLNK